MFIMEPFEQATDINQGEKYVTASTVVPTIICLQHHLQTCDPEYNGQLVRELMASMEKRLQRYVLSDTYRLASVLDPRFKMSWCPAHEQHQLTHMLTEKMLPVVTSEVQPRKRSRPTLFAMLSTLPTTAESGSEISTYLREPCVAYECDPLLYWEANTNRFPELSILSCKYLCVPATSAPVERIFSVAGRITRPDRSRLRPVMVESLVYITCNRHL